MGRRHLAVLFAPFVGVAAAQKRPEAFFKDLALKADALEYFNKVAFDVADAFQEDIYGKLHPGPPTYSPTYPPTFPPTYKPTAYPTYAPPPIHQNPCSAHSHPQELLYVDLDLSKAYSPEENCKKLTQKFLQPFQKEKSGYKDEATCKYGKASGKPVNPKTNKGTAIQPYSPLGVTVVSRGKCSNIYFGQVPGTKLTAPTVDAYGKCLSPFDEEPYGHHRRLDAYESDHHYPVKVYSKGYDYLLSCTCLCEDKYGKQEPKHGYGHGGYRQEPKHGYEMQHSYKEHKHGYGHEQKHGHSHQKHGYGHEPAYHPEPKHSYGYQPPKHGYEEPKYGYGSVEPKPKHGHGYHQPTYSHEPEYGYGHEEVRHEPVYGYEPIGHVPKHGGYEPTYAPKRGGYEPKQTGYGELTYGGGYEPVTYDTYHVPTSSYGLRRRLSETTSTQAHQGAKSRRRLRQRNIAGSRRRMQSRSNRRRMQSRNRPSLFTSGTTTRRMQASGQQPRMQQPNRRMQASFQQNQRPARIMQATSPRGAVHDRHSRRMQATPPRQQSIRGSRI